MCISDCDRIIGTDPKNSCNLGYDKRAAPPAGRRRRTCPEPPALLEPFPQNHNAQLHTLTKKMHRHPIMTCQKEHLPLCSIDTARGAGESQKWLSCARKPQNNVTSKLWSTDVNFSRYISELTKLTMPLVAYTDLGNCEGEIRSIYCCETSSANSTCAWKEQENQKLNLLKFEDVKISCRWTVLIVLSEIS
jgi:hypothetical protein